MTTTAKVVLSIFAVLLLVYRFLLPFTPIWVDVTVGIPLFAICFALYRKKQQDNISGEGRRG
jgi:hypothetical protein